MLSGSRFFLTCALLFNVLMLSSFARPPRNKYAVLIFEDIREYRESGKKIQKINEYYWVLDLEDLYAYKAAPLYIPVDNDAIIAEEGSVQLDNTPLSNLNGLAFEDISKNEYCYGFIEYLRRNRVKKQVIKVNNTAKHGSVKRIKERVNVYYVPIVGGLDKGFLQRGGGDTVPAYYPSEIDAIERMELSEGELLYLSFLDCSTFNFSALENAYDRYNKGFALLRY